MPSRASCCHDHDCQDVDCGAAYSLYKHIDLDGVSCLNESEAAANAFSNPGIRGPTRQVSHPASHLPSSFRPAGSLKSHEGDPELLLRIPFTGSVNLKAIAVIGGTDGRYPSKARAYLNQEVDFQSVRDRSPVQEWDLQEDFRGFLEYPTAASKFKGVRILFLHFPDIVGDAECSEIRFIGLKGEFLQQRREPVVTVYEAKPMPGDHHVPGENQNIWRTGM